MPEETKVEVKKADEEKPQQEGTGDNGPVIEESAECDFQPLF